MAQKIDFSAFRESFSTEEKEAFFEFLKQQEEAEKSWENELSSLPQSNIPEENQRSFLKTVAHNSAYFSCFTSPENLPEEEKKQYANSAKLLAHNDFSFSPELAFATLRLLEQKSLTPLLVDRLERSQKGMTSNPTLFVKLKGNIALKNKLASLEVLQNAERSNIHSAASHTKNMRVVFAPPSSSHLPNIPIKTTPSKNSKSDFDKSVAETGTGEAIREELEKKFRSFAERQKMGEETTILQNIAQKAGKRKFPIGRMAVGSALSTAATAAIFGSVDPASAAALDFLTNL